MSRSNLFCLIALGSLVVATGCSSQAESVSPPAGTVAAATKPSATPAMLEKGRELYKANCVACHGEGGKGDGAAAGALKPPPRDHTDKAYMSTLTDKNLADVIVMGGAIKGKPLMPSHPQLRGPDLDGLVIYVRSLSADK